MKRGIATARGAAAFALAALLVSSRASAQNVPAYLPCVITTTGPQVCLAQGTGLAHVFVGIANNSTSAQANTTTIYDSATATCSGPVVASIAALGATQVITWPAPGRAVTYGVSVCTSSAPTGAGEEVYVR